MINSLVAERLRGSDARDAADAIRHACEHLPPAERAEEFGAVFDRYVWFDETEAVTPRPTRPPAGVPETYPFGV